MTTKDETGNLLFQVVRFNPKGFQQRRPKSDGNWVWSVKGIRAIPYRLPELLADKTLPVVVVEGEKDVDSLAAWGIPATCNAGGAGKWTPDHAAFLAGRDVAIIPDNDEAGQNHALQVARSLHGVAASVRVVTLPNLPLKGDVSDWIAAGGTLDELVNLMTAAPLRDPAVDEPWREIIRFEQLELPEFPTDCLPKVIRDWVKAESHATQTPPDLAALLALAVCSACVARRVIGEPRSGWNRLICMWQSYSILAIGSPPYLRTQ
jgi:hypothetical protein